MEKKDVAQALAYIRQHSPQKKFTQSIDLIVNLKGIDVKNSSHNVNTFSKVCALVGHELESSAKEAMDGVVLADQFSEYKSKKEAKKLAAQYDYFVAQANIMPQVASAFGPVLGPKGKMPNPKAGCVVPPNANLSHAYESLQKTIRIANKQSKSIKCIIGKEGQNEEEVIDNVMTAYNTIIHSLPNEVHNVKSVQLKLTMGPPLTIGRLPQDRKGAEYHA